MDSPCPTPTTASLSTPTSSKRTPISSLNSNSKRFKMVSFVDTITTQQRGDIDMAIAKFFIGCNIAFHLIESSHFKNMIDTLRPAYTPYIPNRRMLAGRLLDKLYNMFISAISITSNFVLLIDGWKNKSTNTKNIVTMLHNSSGERHFLDAWDISEEAETGGKLTEIVDKSYQLARDRYGAIVYAVVSDNASNMIRMGKNVGHYLWHSTCNSHSGNLLAKDCINLTLTEKVTDILKEFKNTTLENALVSKGGTKIKLPCLTRWCSYRNSYDCLIKNLKPMKQVLSDDKYKVSTNSTTLIFDNNFIDDVRILKEEMDPICELINICQSPKANIADAVEKWLNLKVNERNSNLLIERRNKVLNKYNLAAFYLHPGYDQALLSSVHLNTINRFLIRSLDFTGIEDLDCYKNKTGVFKDLIDKNVKSPLIFWNSAHLTHPNLSEFALKLLNIPASSAQIERVFSNWKLIHTPIRNRLHFETSKKLIHCYFSLNACDTRVMEKLEGDMEYITDDENNEP